MSFFVDFYMLTSSFAFILFVFVFGFIIGIKYAEKKLLKTLDLYNRTETDEKV